MGNQYKRLFNSIAPIKSDEELLKAVLDRKAEKNMSPKKKFSKKAILIPAAAAALLGTTAIGVSAAYQWNLPAAFEDMFRDRFEQYNGTSDVKTKNVMFDFSVIGKELDLTYNFDNFDVVIKGIAADEHSAYLLYDVVFAEDYDYALADGEEWALNLRPNIDMSWVMNYSGEMNPAVGSTNGLINMERNTAHCFSTVNIAGISLQDKPLVYSFDSLVRSSGDKKDILGLEETKFSVDLDFYLSGNSVKLRPNESVTLAGGETGTVNYIGLSTFGVELNVEWDDKQIADENKGDLCEKLKNSITINYKDGTTSDNTAFTANYVDGSGSRFGSLNDSYYSGVLLSWVYPVYMRDIESITIGDKTYNVQSACNAAPFDFASIGKELNRVYEFDNYTLNVRGLITDGYSAYIVADVVFDEDFDYAPKDGWYDWDLSIDSDLPGGAGIPGIVNGNTYTFYHKVGTIDNTTLRGKTVTFNFEWLKRFAHFRGSEKDEIAEIPESEKLDCGVTLDVDFDFDVTRGNKTVIGSTPIYLSELFGSGTLTEFTVTPLGIKATVENSDIESAISIKAENNDFDLVLYHADGTMTMVDGFGRLDEGTLYLAGNFEYPLDTSDIVGAKIGDVEVDISAAKFAKASSVEQTAPAFDFSSVGKAIGESFEGLGYTLTVNGVVADAHTAHFIYTIEFNDKFPFDYKHTDVKDIGWFDWGATGFELTVNGEKANIGCSYDSNSDWLNENTLQNSFAIFCDNDTSFENSDLTLTIGALKRTSTGIPDNDMQEIDCGMTVDFSLGEMSGMELDLTPDKTFMLDGIGNVTISKVNITPFKLTCTVLSADGQKVAYDDFFKAVVNGDSGVCVTLKNGTKISAPGITGVQKVGGIECDMDLSYPVNPADVASVTICGREIALTDTAETKPAKYDFSQLDGKELNQTIKGNGFTLTLDKVVADVHNAYILYTLEFDEDTNYASGTPNNWSFNFKAKLDGKERSGAVGNTIPYLEDGVLKGSFRLTYSEYDLTDSTITLSFNSLNYNRTTISPLEEKHIGFVETVDIVMDFDLRASEILTLTPNIRIEADGVTAVLSEIEVTPFGMNYTVDLPEELADEDFDVFKEAVGKVQEALDNPEYGSIPLITFDDGSVGYDLITSGTGSIGSTMINEHLFTRPVDTSKIKSITFGAYTVDVH